MYKVCKCSWQASKVLLRAVLSVLLQSNIGWAALLLKSSQLLIAKENLRLTCSFECALYPGIRPGLGTTKLNCIFHESRICDIESNTFKFCTARKPWETCSTPSGAHKKQSNKAVPHTADELHMPAYQCEVIAMFTDLILPKAHCLYHSSQ